MLATNSKIGVGKIATPSERTAPILETLIGGRCVLAHSQANRCPASSAFRPQLFWQYSRPSAEIATPIEATASARGVGVGGGREPRAISATSGSTGTAAAERRRCTRPQPFSPMACRITRRRPPYSPPRQRVCCRALPF